MLTVHGDLNSLTSTMPLLALRHPDITDRVKRLAVSAEPRTVRDASIEEVLQSYHVERVIKNERFVLSSVVKLVLWWSGVLSQNFLSL